MYLLSLGDELLDGRFLSVLFICICRNQHTLLERKVRMQLDAQCVLVFDER